MSLLQLPPPLAPWAPFLDLLPLESAIALGPLLQRLNAFVGPMRAAPLSGSVEPDGFDGLARRGSVERLLLSEWLLLEEAPMEFLRRFSGGESAYFQIARRDPHAARASLALFDCGPQTLGGPRLVELAALLVLARRAESAGATFRWGVWQKPGEWRESVNREAVEWWLGLRTESEPTARQRADWEEVWAEEGADLGSDELWMVGSSALGEFVPKRARFLEIGDELDPFAPNRAVLVESEGRTLRLETPDDAVGARLVRDPFGSIAPKSGDKNSFDVEPLDQGLVWAQSGWKLFGRAQSGQLLVFSVPNSPLATVGPPKTHRATGGLVAVGRVGRATVAAVLMGRKQGEKTSSFLRFQSWGRNSGQWNDVELPFAQELGETNSEALKRAPMGTVLGSGDGTVLALWLEKRRLQIAVRGAETLREESMGVRGMAMSGGSVQLVRSTNSQIEILNVSAAGSLVTMAWRSSMPSLPLLDVHSGWSGNAASPLWALQGENEWQLRTSETQSALCVSGSRQVVGCVFDGNESGLLLHTPGERELWIFAGQNERKLLRFSSLIRAINVCPFAPLVAVQGEKELGVWSLPHGAWLLRSRWD